MFCPKCGSEQLPGTTFCSDCGSELPKISNIISDSKNTISSPNQTNINQVAQDPFNQLRNMPNLNNKPSIGMQQMPYPNQMPNIGMQKMPIGMQNIPNMGMQQMPYPNQMHNMGMQQMPYPNQMHNMGMQQMPYPNMGMQQMPNQQININIINQQSKKKHKNKFLAAIFAFVLGGFGGHKFYLGKYGWGILYALFPFFNFLIAMAADSPEIALLSFLPSFVSFIEGIMYLIMSNEDFQKKY